MKFRNRLDRAAWVASPIDRCLAYCHASCLVDHDRRAESVRQVRSAHLLTVVAYYSTHVTATGVLSRFTLCADAMLCSLNIAGKWVAPARQQCSTF